MRMIKRHLIVMNIRDFITPWIRFVISVILALYGYDGTQPQNDRLETVLTYTLGINLGYAMKNSAVALINFPNELSRQYTGEGDRNFHNFFFQQNEDCSKQIT